ncbi:hypothetical protein CsatA_002721 [Cannabis sativa]
MATSELLFLADHFLEFLSVFPLEDYSLFKPLTNDLHRLERDISFAQALVQDEAFQRIEDSDLGTLLNDLLDPTFEAIFLVRKMWWAVSKGRDIPVAKRVRNFFSSFSNPRSTHNLCLDFKNLVKKVHDVVIKIRHHRIVRELRETHSHVDEGGVVGRDMEKTKIIKLILQNDKDEVRVIPVVGIQGIGKTTLARIVYNDDEIRNKFQLRLWVFVGTNHDCNTRKIVMRLLEGLGVSTNRNLQMDLLQKELKKAIIGKRCFIVMDDMGDDSHLYWNSIKDLIMGCAKDSCVLITTRSEKVAKITCSAAQSYCLNGLAEEDSWALLRRNGFIREGSVVTVEVRKIVEKCEGVPLGLLAISRILRDEDHASLVSSKDVEEIINREMRRKDLVAESDRESRVANAEWRETHSFVPQDMVVGRDEEKEAIIAELLEENDTLPLVVIPIVGIGGLGKTALAQLIFNDEKVECHFDLKIWVCVGDVFYVKEIIEKIILCIIGNYTKDLELAQLLILLHQEMEQKRYLLVLDDVWNEDEEEWNEFIDMISVGANGSRIIVTTRNKAVAEITGKESQWELKALDGDKSWSLFKKVAFMRGEESNNDQVIEIGKDIVNKCGGVPLVIRSIGSILFSKNPETEWQSFNEKKFSEILENESDVFASLRLSYDHLSSALKDCFAYCALFPKDYEFDVQELITLWISQGLVGSDWIRWCGEEDLEDLGYYDYFMDLLRRSFFQETGKDEFGRITKCKMQSLMHDLARKVAGNTYATLTLKEDKFDEIPRHVSFDFHIDSSWQIPIQRVDQSIRIRSLLLPKQFRWAIEGKSSESICDVIVKFKSLRTLDLHNSGIKVLPSSICELKHLQYLDLSHNVNIKKLPGSISRLENLKTLKLNYCSNLQTLPKGITKLFLLRNLENESCYCLTQMPRGLHQLVHLRKLSEFVLSKSTSTSSVSKKSGKLDELSYLYNLRGKLKIKNLRVPEDDKTAEANLYEKQHLLSLMLIWDITELANQDHCEKALEDLKPHPNLRELSLYAYGGSKFSSWLPSLEKLAKLSLSRCNRCHCLPPLDHLTSLQVLVVDELTELQYIMDEPSSSTTTTAWFSSLKELRLTNLPKLKGWWNHDASEEKEEEEEEATFTHLSKLVVEDCPRLTSMPLFPCLEELLVLKNTSWKPFQQTVKIVPTSTSSFTVAPLSKLRTLYIMDMSNGDPRMWHFLSNLRSLTLDHIGDVNHELKGLQQVTSLQQLHIRRCDNFKEIPSWISNSKLLKTISIKLCPKLTIPRERINLITTIKKVEIEDCPEVSHLESMLQDPLYNR